MKTRLLTAVWLCICLVLTACAAKDPDNLFEVTTTAPASTVVATNGGVETTEPVQWNGTFEFEDYTALGEIYQHGNMQKLPAGEFLRLGNDVLFTFIGDSGLKLYRYDLATGEARLFCDDATCRHTGCLAGAFRWGLEVSQGKLYGLTRDKQAAVVEGTELRPIANGQVSGFFHYDNKTYIKTADGDLAVLEEDNGEIKILLEEFVCDWKTVFDNYLYATTSDNIIRVDLSADAPAEEILISNATGITDGQHIYYADHKTYYLYRCDMDGSNAELLLEQPVLPASWNYDDEYFYYRLYTNPKLDEGEDCYDLYRFPKSNPGKVEKICTMPAPAYQVYTVPGADILFVNAYVQSNGKSQDIYVMGTDGSNPTKLEIPEY